MNYQQFLQTKAERKESFGFKPTFLPDSLFDFQKALCEWAIEKGRGAIFASCGLGKSLMELVYAENILRKTNKNVLLITPLAVAPQMVREGEKFGIEVHRTKQGEVHKGINVTNFHRLSYYNPKDFHGVILDESGILKHFSAKTRKAITEFMSSVPYRLLATATPAPNDFMELGSSAEALGIMSYNQMLGMFFTNDGETTQKWRLKGHARTKFWQWMALWSRAVRAPSDLGFDDRKFILPKLNIIHHVLKTQSRQGFFPKIAITLNEQRGEKRKQLEQRCQKVAQSFPKGETCISWCQLNSEGDLLTEMIPNAVQVKGSDPDDKKEEDLNAFALGKIKALVTKPSIAGFGLNLQCCHNVSYFPDHSHERYYQAIRRCWRFGQKKEVTCNLVYSEAEKAIVTNMIRKEQQSEAMYAGICKNMNFVQKEKSNGQVERMDVPSWLKVK